MNRPILVAAFAVCFATASLPAQHGGGGHASAGGHAGFGGSHAFGGFHSGSGFSGHSLNRGSAFGRGSFRAPLRGNSGIGLRLRTSPYYRGCWGGYCGYGYGGWGYPYLWGGVDPYWWWGNDSGSDDQANNGGYGYGYGPYGYDDGLANQMQQQGIPLRPMPPSGENYHAQNTPPQQQQSSAIAPATVLIFRDQHQEEIQNYAIVGETLWNFSVHPTQKIPLSDLDLPATQKANDARGVDFRLPSSSEGQ
jgi:hypothetical protein